MACKSLVHCSCFSGHASTGCQHEWRECSSFHFSNALAVFIAFLRFMLFVDGCELPLSATGRERINNPHIEKFVLVIPPETRGTDVEPGIVFFFADRLSFSPLRGCSSGTTHTFRQVSRCKFVVRLRTASCLWMIKPPHRQTRAWSAEKAWSHAHFSGTLCSGQS